MLGPPLLDDVERLELGGEVGCVEVGEHPARSDIHPGVLVDQALQEAPPVRPLVAEARRRGRAAARRGSVSAPPSPQPTFLVSWKLKAPSAPNVPSGRPSKLAPERLGRVLHQRESAAGPARAASMSQELPGVVDGDDGARPRRAQPLHLLGSRFPFESTSAKTGRAPRSTKALAVETKVKDGTMNSSPGSTSEEERGHLQRMGAGGDQEGGLAECPLEKGLAALAERAPARHVPVGR